MTESDEHVLGAQIGKIRNLRVLRMRSVMGLNKVTQYPKVFASRIDPFKTLSPAGGTKILRRAISPSSKYIVSSQLK